MGSVGLLYVGAVLFVNGLMLFGAEALRRRAPVRDEAGIQNDQAIARRLSFRDALGIGTALQHPAGRTAPSSTPASMPPSPAGSRALATRAR